MCYLYSVALKEFYLASARKIYKWTVSQRVAEHSVGIKRPSDFLMVLKKLIRRDSKKIRMIWK